MKNFFLFFFVLFSSIYFNTNSNSEIVKKTLEHLNISTEIYSNVKGNPTGTNVIEGVNFYKKKIVMV